MPCWLADYFFRRPFPLLLLLLLFLHLLFFKFRTLDSSHPPLFFNVLIFLLLLVVVVLLALTFIPYRAVGFCLLNENEYNMENKNEWMKIVDRQQTGREWTKMYESRTREWRQKLHYSNVTLAAYVLSSHVQGVCVFGCKYARHTVSGHEQYQFRCTRTIFGKSISLFLFSVHIIL